MMLGPDVVQDKLDRLPCMFAGCQPASPPALHRSGHTRAPRPLRGAPPRHQPHHPEGERQTMRRFFVAATAALALAACSDIESGNPLSVEGGPGERGPALATAPVGPQWSIFTSQTPEQTLDATPGWEVGTRFSTSKAGKVIGFRFYRASGETGTNTARLWSNSGTQLASATFTTSGTGWQTVMLPTGSRVSLTVNTTYRVSVNTNSAQAKSPGAFYYGGPVTNGPLTADGGYYGQPTGAMPASESTSNFFVDVIFEEDVPLPNLYVQRITAFGGKNYWGQEIIDVVVCNNGAASAGATTTKLKYWWANGGPWQFQWERNLATP